MTDNLTTGIFSSISILTSTYVQQNKFRIGQNLSYKLSLVNFPPVVSKELDLLELHEAVFWALELCPASNEDYVQVSFEFFIWCQLEWA